MSTVLIINIQTDKHVTTTYGKSPSLGRTKSRNIGVTDRLLFSLSYIQIHGLYCILTRLTVLFALTL